jgi:hypothetical protein
MRTIEELLRSRKPRLMAMGIRCADHATTSTAKKMEYRDKKGIQMLVKNLKRRNHMGDLSINGRIIFRWILALENFDLNSQAFVSNQMFHAL